MAEIQPVSRFAPASDAYLREQLRERRSRLTAPGVAARAEAQTLLREVDAALARLREGSYGLCEACHDPLEAERLLAEPLTRVCIGCLTPDQARDLERDLELAGRVQSALLPDERIAVDGWEIQYRYRPLGPVSGDHCDVLMPAGPDGILHFVLGDVSGKGISASIVMSHLHAIFRSLVPLGLSLSDLMRHANRLLAECTLPSSYATAIVGRLDPAGHLEISNAGHCPALLARNGSIASIGSTGLPLGLFNHGDFEVDRIDLVPEELLLLYTDGVSEALNGSGESYGTDRIGRLLGDAEGESVATLLDALIDDVAAFSRATPRADDVTLMAVRRRNGALAA